MNTSITDGQMMKFLLTARDKEATPESIQRAFSSGIISAALDPNANFGKMPTVLSALGLRGDTIVRITRPVRPSYPSWIKQVIHPELEDVGPGEYDLASIVCWFHDAQKFGGRSTGTGTQIYEDLKRNDRLKTCLGLRDGEEIQKKGIDVFCQFFKKQTPFLWKSIGLDSSGRLNVPYLSQCLDRVNIGWFALGGGFKVIHPAARFAS